MTAAFQALSNAPTVNVVDEVMPILERYVIIMYDCTSTCMKVNDARRDLFTRAPKGRDIEAITSTCKEVHIPGWPLLGQFLGAVSYVSVSK